MFIAVGGPEAHDLMPKMSLMKCYKGLCSSPEESFEPSGAVSFCNGVRSARTMWRISRTRSKKEGLPSGDPFAKGTILGVFIRNAVLRTSVVSHTLLCTVRTVVVSVCLSGSKSLDPWWHEMTPAIAPS